MGILNYTYKDIEKKLKKLGFEAIRSGKGSHIMRTKESLDYSFPVPNHGNKTISKGVIKEIISYTGLSNKEFHDL